MLVLLDKYLVEPSKSGGQPDGFTQFHLVLAAFGSIAVVLLIAHHEIDDDTTMPLRDHPSFDGRLAGILEAIEAALTARDSPLDQDSAYRTMRVITELRAPLETVIFGALPSARSPSRAHEANRCVRPGLSCAPVCGRDSHRAGDRTSSNCVACRSAAICHAADRSQKGIGVCAKPDSGMCGCRSAAEM
jgi:hypothetical protein